MHKLRAWFRWVFLGPRLVWILISTLGLASIVLWSCSELIFRTYGFGLQIIGVFFAAQAVFSNERLFEQPRIKERIGQWCKARPGARHTAGSIFSSSAAVTCSMRATLRTPKADTDTLDEQVTKLWRNIDLLSQELTGLTREFDLNKRTFDMALKAEREAREHSHKSLRELVKEATVGAPLLAYFGVILALMGSTITTYSQYLHDLVK